MAAGQPKPTKTNAIGIERFILQRVNRSILTFFQIG